MLFNQNEKFTLDEISSMLKLPRNQLHPVIQSLIRIDLVRVYDRERQQLNKLEDDTEGDTEVQLNGNFAKYRFIFDTITPI